VVPHDQGERVEGEGSQHARTPAAPAPCWDRRNVT
jgi:hypothetical protein